MLRLGPNEKPVVDERAKIRAATQAENEKMRRQMEASEARLLAPDYRGYVDDGDVVPGHGADSAYSLDLSPDDRKTTPKGGLDVNPSQNAPAKGGDEGGK